MSSRTLAKTKNQNSTTFSPVFSKKLSGRTFTPKSANEARDVSNPEFGHNFEDVQVESPSFKQSCPLSLSGPAHCPFGGACHKCPPRIQAKLKISQPGDKYEQEADRVAEQVMRMPEPQAQRKRCSSCKKLNEEELIQAKPIAGHITPLVQRQIEEEEEEEILQTKEVPSHTPEVTPDVQMNINNLRGSGKPLAESERSFFEQRFGYDFSQVRVHTGSIAGKVSRDVNASAFTIGQDVVFGAGQYAPETNIGQRLLAHELIHVIQQRNSRKLYQVKELSDVDEQEATGKAHRLKSIHGFPLIQSPMPKDRLNRAADTQIRVGKRVNVIGREADKEDPNIIKAAENAFGSVLKVNSLSHLIEVLKQQTNGNCISELHIYNHGLPFRQRVAKITSKGDRGFTFDWLTNNANQERLNELRNVFCCKDPIMHWHGCATAGIEAKGGLGRPRKKVKKYGRRYEGYYSSVYRSPELVARHGATLFGAELGSVNLQLWANATCASIRGATDFTNIGPDETVVKYQGKWTTKKPQETANCVCDPDTGHRKAKAPKPEEIFKTARGLRAEVLHSSAAINPDRLTEEQRERWDWNLFLYRLSRRRNDNILKEMILNIAIGINPPSPLEKKPIEPFISSKIGNVRGIVKPYLAICHPDNYWHWMGFTREAVVDTPYFTRSVIEHELQHAVDIANNLKDFQSKRGSLKVPRPSGERCERNPFKYEDEKIRKWRARRNDPWGMYIQDPWGRYVNDFMDFHEGKLAPERHLDISVEQKQYDMRTWTEREKISWFMTALGNLPQNVEGGTPLSSAEELNKVFNEASERLKGAIAMEYQKRYITEGIDKRYGYLKYHSDAPDAPKVAVRQAKACGQLRTLINHLFPIVGAVYKFHKGAIDLRKSYNEYCLGNESE